MSGLPLVARAEAEVPAPRRVNSAWRNAAPSAPIENASGWAPTRCVKVDGLPGAERIEVGKGEGAERVSQLALVVRIQLTSDPTRSVYGRARSVNMMSAAAPRVRSSPRDRRAAGPKRALHDDGRSDGVGTIELVA